MEGSDVPTGDETAEAGDDEVEVDDNVIHAVGRRSAARNHMVDDIIHGEDDDDVVHVEDDDDMTHVEAAAVAALYDKDY